MEKKTLIKYKLRKGILFVRFVTSFQRMGKKRAGRRDMNFSQQYTVLMNVISKATFLLDGKRKRKQKKKKEKLLIKAYEKRW